MIKSSEKSFETVLHRAIRCNYLKVVKYLVGKGANVNQPFINITQKKKDHVKMSDAEKQNFMQDVEFYQKKLKTLMEQYAQIKKELDKGNDEMSDKLSDVAWEI